MLMLWRCAVVAGLALPRLLLGQIPDGVPPEPAHDADLPALAAWIARWLPVIGATTYSNIDSTADFYARSSDSVLAARLEGCTLVLHERSVSIAHGWRSAQHLAIHVPLGQVDTALVQPKIRQARLLLNRPNVLLYGQLVVPLRNRARTEFITVFADGGSGYPMLVGEHQVPFVFAQIAAARSALVLRRAAARCATDSGP
jgi:hypothetical protein